VKKIIIAVCLLIGTNVNAQKNFWQKLSGGFNASIGIPQGEFKEVNKDAAFGIRGHIMFNPNRKIPVLFGAELGYAVMGSRSVYFMDNWFDQYQMTASSNIFSAQFKLRLQQQKIAAVRPFAEGIIGWNDFFSTVNVERQTFYGPGFNEGYGDASEAEWALTYGGAGGVDIKLNKEGNLWLEVKAAYMIGRKAFYLTNPQISSNGQVTFDAKESETNMLIPQVGVKFGL
jgi:hypothetical protein